MQEMVLEDVADGAGLVVELAAALHAEGLGHGDLHALDVVTIPNGLEEAVGEAERQEVLDRSFAEEVIDAKHIDPSNDAWNVPLSSRAEAES